MADVSTTAAASSVESRLGSGLAWWIWILAVAFVVYLFSFQTGYSIVNPSVQKDVGLSVAQVATIAYVIGRIPPQPSVSRRWRAYPAANGHRCRLVLDCASREHEGHRTS